MAERSNAAVLKTVDLHGSGGSNPSLSARLLRMQFSQISMSFCHSHCPRGQVRVYCGIALLCVILLFSSCAKEQGIGMFDLFIEDPANASKLAVEGVHSYWESGDAIWVNGACGNVAFTDGSSPTVTFTNSVENWNDHYYAAYPASICSTGTEQGVLTVTLPDSYQYSQDGTGRQQLPMPMVACSTGSHLLFKHLTASVVVKIPAVSSNVVLDYVAVRSSVAPLSGTATVGVTNDDYTLNFANTDTTHTVTMFFNNTTLNLNAVRYVAIPVPPVPSSNKFTVTILAHTSGNSPTWYLFEQTQTTGGELARNTLAYAPVSAFNSSSTPFLGTGTQSAPYLIHNKEDYKNFLNCIQNGSATMCSAYYLMVGDADCHNETLQSSTQYFSGHFNGNGHTIKNATVKSRSITSPKRYMLSIFPPIQSPGEVNNLTVDNISLDCTTGVSDYGSMYCGGLTYSVKVQYGSNVNLSGVVISNVHVLSAFSPYVEGVYFGGIVGAVIFSGTQSTDALILNMETCNFQLQSNTLELDVQNCTNFYFGGYVAHVDGVYVKMKDCTVSLGGSTSNYGVLLIADVKPSYVGAAFGYAYNYAKLSASQGGCSLSGYMLFTGNNSNNKVNKVLGYAENTATTYFAQNSPLVHSELHVYKRDNSNANSTEISDTGYRQ